MNNMIDLNITLFIQLANFLVTVVVLNYLLIKPIRNQIAARKELTAGYADAIEKFTAEAAAKLSNYEQALSGARAEAALAREALKAEGVAQEQKTVQAAHSQAQAYLLSSREQVAKEARTAMDILLSQVNTLAEKAMSKILG